MFIQFVAVMCPKLTVPDNGGVIPASCSRTGVEYGTRCVFYCDDGYELSGPRYSTCQADTSWSEIAPLSCVRGMLMWGRGIPLGLPYSRELEEKVKFNSPKSIEP